MDKGMIEPNEDDAEGLFSTGNRYLEAKDFSSAEAHFRRIVENEPDRAEAHTNLGFALENKGAPEEAECHYRRALALDPECAEAYVNLGTMLVRQKRFQEAEGVYEGAIQARPDSPAVWSCLGTLHACLKREVEAEWCFRPSSATGHAATTCRSPARGRSRSSTVSEARTTI